MDDSRSASGADPLVWGSGPKVVEMFLEPTCPFSARAFGKIDDLIALVGADRITVKIRFVSQPWHMFSGVIVRAILAASTSKKGKEDARTVMAAIYANRDEFEFEDHRAGPNLDSTPTDILERIKTLSGVDVAEAFQISALQADVKWHTKYVRQNGVHVSPSFQVDGLIANQMSSGDTVEEWANAIGLR
ncbi:thioredoxin domain-containing protein [Roseibium sp. MMSF_3544]|uniref:DsbA family protein n=1 Tax=unclassified Roseibium TaxID=2629323 RepID=UPI00273D5394|nr:thioredoxin domain-containing protein [Roseibium sp. MMSF_3544]